MAHLTKLLHAFCLFEYGTIIQAQNTISTTGGNASGVGGSLSYTIGQVFYNPISGITRTVTQGVQQSYEISVVTAIEKAKDINLTCSVYPNPATDYLTLKIDASTSLSILSLSYQLFDMNGKLLETKNLKATKQALL